ncbi:MAG: hypothetical protein M3401_03760 [Actinomycetota bacterium]|nr:hypothetical protein [Actinomycetota bacterium]
MHRNFSHSLRRLLDGIVQNRRARTARRPAVTVGGTIAFLRLTAQRSGQVLPMPTSFRPVVPTDWRIHFWVVSQ